MTVKELNLQKRRMWTLLMECPDISKTVKSLGKAIVYDVKDYRNHKIMVVGYDTQVNHNTLACNGIDPETAICTRLFTVLANHNIIFG